MTGRGRDCSYPAQSRCHPTGRTCFPWRRGSKVLRRPWGTVLTPRGVPRGRPASAGHATARTFRGLADVATVTEAETLTTTMTAGTVADAVAAAAVAGIPAGVSTGVAATGVATATGASASATAATSTATAAATSTAATAATTAAATAATSRQRGSGRQCDDGQKDHESMKEAHVAVPSFREDNGISRASDVM